MNIHSCKLLEGTLTYFLQCLLGIISMSSIYWKWTNEYPKREKKVVIFDVSKQVIGMGFAHLLNISIAIMMSKRFTINDECRWYFLNFFVDVSFGIPLNYILIRISNYYINKNQLKYLTTGEYSNTMSYCNISYMQQLLLWILIILVSKMLLLALILLPAHNILNDFGRWFLKPVSHNTSAELAVVMVVLPLILNIIQFWIQDNFLKGSKHYIEPCTISNVDITNDHIPETTTKSPKLTQTLISPSAESSTF
jgi:hypothetical protein